MAKTKKTKQQKTNDNVVEQEATKAVGMVQERMVANVRDNFYDSNRVLWITGEINEIEQYDIIKWLHFFNDGSKLPVTIYINSLGGAIYIMNAIIDLIDALKKNGIVVYTVCIGAAMSAAALILASGTKGYRYVSPNSTVMIHSAQSLTAEGQFKTKDVSLQAKWMERIQDSMEKMLVSATGQTISEIKKAVEYETYFSAKEAVKFGLADKVGTYVI